MITTLALACALQSGTMNTLTPKEKSEGWELLFDGKTTKGWHNYKAPKGKVGEGWQVKDGVLIALDPEKTGGDIVTDANYEWFELELDFNCGPGQNSGVMFHVTEQGEASWHSGPEIQIYDDHGEEGAQKSGYLYELYKPEKETVKPAGEWNHFRIVISGKGCATYVNGTKYYDYVLNSDDFKARLAKSKFAEFPEFAQAASGGIAIQGDHGVVGFRNIKIKKLKE